MTGSKYYLKQFVQIVEVVIAYILGSVVAETCLSNTVFQRLGFMVLFYLVFFGIEKLVRKAFKRLRPDGEDENAEAAEDEPEE